VTAALHDLAATVDCPKKPRGCSAPTGQRCVNWAVARDPDQHPPATRAPHPARLRAAQAAIPEQRQIEAPTDDAPLPPEPDDEWEPW
jgi:hypothetical protein